MRLGVQTICTHYAGGTNGKDPCSYSEIKSVAKTIEIVRCLLDIRVVNASVSYVGGRGSRKNHSFPIDGFSLIREKSGNEPSMTH